MQQNPSLCDVVYNQVTKEPQADAELQLSPWFGKLDFDTYFLADKDRLHLSRDNFVRRCYFFALLHKNKESFSTIFP